MPQATSDQITVLKDRAIKQSAQIGQQLAAGVPPETLVALLKTQAETIAQLQTLVAEWAGQDHLATRRKDIQDLKQTLLQLVQAAEQNVQKATQKGMRLTGIGGKPYVPKRKPKTF